MSHFHENEKANFNFKWRAIFILGIIRHAKFNEIHDVMVKPHD